MRRDRLHIPEFRELFPELPALRCAGHLTQHLGPAAVIPVDAHGSVLASTRSPGRPALIQLPDACTTNFVTLTLHKLRERYGAGITVTDVSPIGSISHDLNDQLIIRARVLGPIDIQPEAPATHVICCRAIDLHRQSIRDVGTSYYDTEIATHLRLRTRYRLHRGLFGPLRRCVAATTGQRSTDDLARLLVDLMGKHADGGPLIDLACGDSTLFLDAASTLHAPFMVRNDVSCTMALVPPVRRHARHTVVTCLDARSLPFGKQQFSVALVKNVLHHMPSAHDARSLLAEALRISRSVVLCEILDPERVGGYWGRLRHRYYRRYLPDPGDQFLDSSEFDALVSTTTGANPTDRVDYRTINGTYACAILKPVRNRSTSR